MGYAIIIISIFIINRMMAVIMNKRLTAAVSAAVYMLFSSGAQAEGGKSSMELQPISVEGTTPVIGQGVPVEQLQRNLAATVSDVFKDQTSVTVGGGARSAQRLYFRGVDGNNLNITIDGAVQGRSLFQHHGGIGSLDPDLLKQVEVLTGVGADRGPGALGGAIRFETVDAQDLLELDQDTGSTVRTGYHSANRSDHGALTAYTRLGEQGGLLAHVKGVNRGDYESGDGRKIHGTGGRDRHYFMKFSMLDQDAHSVRLSAERSENRGEYRWGRGDLAYDPEAPLEQQIHRRDAYVLNYGFDPVDRPLLNTGVNLFSNELNLINEDRNTETISQGKGLEIRNASSFSLGQWMHDLVLGMDHYREDGKVVSQGARDGQRSEVSHFGIFVQESAAVGRFTLSGGARLDRYESDYGAVQVTGNEISPNAGIEVDLGMGWSTFAGYGEAVRSSGVIPIGWFASAVDEPEFNAEPGKRRFGKSLAPERSRQRELGLRYRGNDVLAQHDRLNASITYFQNDIDNLIVQTGGSRGQPVTGFYNDDRVTSKGWEMKARWSTHRYRTTLSYTRAKLVDEQGDRVDTIRRVGSNTGDRLAWDHAWQASEALDIGYTLIAQAGLSDGDLDRSGYTLHHVQASWYPRQAPDLTLSLAVRNLFDKEYSEQTTIGGDEALPEAGRDIRMMASYRF
ncbi:TonB-dependent receptor domain-containing protein [Ectothiorhodospira marina]|jgi:hemoglobin/transferrin/lactoferrin receptor protein|nr:TonB-dependent receptor [Ectothiorhodospira marina]